MVCFRPADEVIPGGMFEIFDDSEGESVLWKVMVSVLPEELEELGVEVDDVDIKVAMGVIQADGLVADLMV